MWTQDRNGEMKMDCIDVKGLQLVRRDNIPFVREVSREILDVILESKNPEGAKKVARARAVELLDGRVPMEKLTLSQKLADSYKSTSLPHVTVRDKIRKREPGSEPQSGDRVPFVLVDTGDPRHRQFEKAEDPKWVEKKNLPLDYLYYLTNKFMNPICDLLAPLVPNPQTSIFADLLPKKKPRGKKPMSTGGERKIEDIFAMHKLKQKNA
jgi:DNA polymerase delta subunit 1